MLPILYTTESVPNALENQKKKKKKPLKQMFALNTLPYFTFFIYFFRYFFRLLFSCSFFTTILMIFIPVVPVFSNRQGWLCWRCLATNSASDICMIWRPCICKCSRSIVCRTHVPCTYARQKI